MCTPQKVLERVNGLNSLKLMEMFDFHKVPLLQVHEEA